MTTFSLAKRADRNQDCRLFFFVIAARKTSSWGAITDACLQLAADGVKNERFDILVSQLAVLLCPSCGVTPHDQTLTISSHAKSLPNSPSLTRASSRQASFDVRDHLLRPGRAHGNSTAKGGERSAGTRTFRAAGVRPTHPGSRRVVTRPPRSWRSGIGAISWLCTWHTTLAGALIGFLMGQAMAVTWIALSHAEKAQQRESPEAVPRAIAARCLESAPHRMRVKDACRASDTVDGVES